MTIEHKKSKSEAKQLTHMPNEQRLSQLEEHYPDKKTYKDSVWA